MTVEQVLIYSLAAIAGIFLFLGLAQALDARPPRPRRRRGRQAQPPDDETPSAGRSAEEPDVVPAWARPGAAREPAASDEVPPEVGRSAIAIPSPVPTVGAPALPVEQSPAVERPSAVELASASERSTAVEAMSPGEASVVESASAVARGADAEPVPLRAAAPASSVAAPARAAAAVPPAPSAADPDLVLVEDAMALCLAGRHGEVLERVEPRLAAEREAGVEGQRSHVTTALHSLIGLARQATGDVVAARVSFAAGVCALPEPGSVPCPPRIAALSVPVARRLLDGGPDRSEGDEEARAGQRLTGGRLAAFWLSWRLHAAPGDEDTLALLGAAREATAESLDQTIVASIERHDYRAALALVKASVEVGELPSARGEVLLELLGVTFRQEIDRLTAAAMRGGKDDDPAVSGLGQAEALAATLPDGAISPAHRAGVARRIWRGHSKLGFRRLYRGEFDAAADTLFHALGMREIGRRRQRQVRDALVRALEGLGDQGVATVGALLAEGQGTEAAEAIERLGRHVERAREHGVLDEELEVASGRLEQLRRRLADATPG